MCRELGSLEKNREMANIGITLCQIIKADSLVRDVTQIDSLLGDCECLRDFCIPQKDTPRFLPNTQISILNKSNPQKNLWERQISSHFVGEVLDVTVIRIEPYGVLVKLDDIVSGLIHISKIDNRYISDVYSEFDVDEVCQARIIEINEPENKVALSTKGLGKFAQKKVT